MTTQTCTSCANSSAEYAEPVVAGGKCLGLGAYPDGGDQDAGRGSFSPAEIRLACVCHKEHRRLKVSSQIVRKLAVFIEADDIADDGLTSTTPTAPASRG